MHLLGSCVCSITFSVCVFVRVHGWFRRSSKFRPEMVHIKTEWTDTELKDVKVEKHDSGTIMVVVMSRPKMRNAWTEKMRNEVAYCMDLASKDPIVRVVIITGDPAGKAFCAGMDMSTNREDNPTEMPGDVPDGRPVNNSYWRDGGGTAGLAIMRCAKPVIAAVNDTAVGVGMTLPVCCDMSVAADDSKYGFVFGKRGLTMECLSSTLLVRHVGWKKAMELVLTGRLFKGRDAPDGLFNYVVPASEVLPKALALAREVAETTPVAAMLNRTMIIRNMNMSPEEAHLVESSNIRSMLEQPDTMEGIRSFLEKRPPKFTQDAFRDVPAHFPWWRELVTRSKL
eukprot:TRINITY_DN39243_c0_g1_i1.p1 TRINITY_DN39243_c0_g1~~TRINITY_DN39243_c0_g1_i1.p1  ORF type:complete len:340 (+),score=48.55 TRINITY_DN39243_c0_g1_i1:214-1233(+)